MYAYISLSIYVYAYKYITIHIYIYIYTCTYTSPFCLLPARQALRPARDADRVGVQERVVGEAAPGIYIYIYIYIYISSQYKPSRLRPRKLGLNRDTLYEFK